MVDSMGSVSTIEAHMANRRDHTDCILRYQIMQDLLAHREASKQRTEQYIVEQAEATKAKSEALVAELIKTPPGSRRYQEILNEINRLTTQPDTSGLEELQRRAEPPASLMAELKAATDPKYYQFQQQQSRQQPPTHGYQDQAQQPQAHPQSYHAPPQTVPTSPPSMAQGQPHQSPQPQYPYSGPQPVPNSPPPVMPQELPADPPPVSSTAPSQSASAAGGQIPPRGPLGNSRVRTPSPGPRPPSRPQTTSSGRVQVLGHCPAAPDGIEFEAHWHQPVGVPDFLVCTKCFEEKVRPTPFANQFECVFLGACQEKRSCLFASKRSESLLAEAVRTGNFAPLQDYMQLRSKMKSCTGPAGIKGSAGIGWYVAKNDHIPGLVICESCYHDVVMATILIHSFEPNKVQQPVDQLWACDIATPYISRALWAASENGSWNEFVYAARKRLKAPPCDADKAVESNT